MCLSISPIAISVKVACCKVLATQKKRNNACFKQKGMFTLKIDQSQFFS